MKYNSMCPICGAKAVCFGTEFRGAAIQLPFTCTGCELRWTFTTSENAFRIAQKYNGDRNDTLNKR